MESDISQAKKVLNSLKEYGVAYNVNPGGKTISINCEGGGGNISVKDGFFSSQKTIDWKSLYSLLLAAESEK